MLDNRNGSDASVTILSGDLDGRFFFLTTKDTVVWLSGKKDRRVSVCLNPASLNFLRAVVCVAGVPGMSTPSSLFGRPRVMWTT